MNSTEMKVTLALRKLAAAEQALGRLTFGQTVDLLADNFTWSLVTCREIAHAVFSNLGRTDH